MRRGSIVSHHSSLGLPSEGICRLIAWGGSAREEAARGVPLHAHYPAALLPVAEDHDLVAPRLQRIPCPLRDAPLYHQPPRVLCPRIERAREVQGVERRRVQRRLHVHPELDHVQEELQRPLVLLVAARRAEREPWPPVPGSEGRRQCCPRALARPQAV